jgi:integrase/recombinase XerC
LKTDSAMGSNSLKGSDLNMISSLHIRGFLGMLYKKNKKTTTARKLSAIRSFFKYLVKNGCLKVSPAKMVSTPKREKTIPAYLPVDEMFRLLDSIKMEGLLDLRNRAIFETMYSTGIRVSELAGLNAPDIDFDRKLVRVLGKGKKERVVPVGKKALSFIKNYRGQLESRKGRTPQSWAAFFEQRPRTFDNKVYRTNIGKNHPRMCPDYSGFPPCAKAFFCHSHA